MGIMNLLQANWRGKVGQTVGAKWKNLSTIRSYTKPAYTNTPAQQEIRSGFGSIASFTALFTDQLKSLSPLNTKGMSVRNAIIQLNKEMLVSGALDPAALRISRGGLPSPSAMSITAPAGLTTIKAAWMPAVGATISTKARVVVVAVNQATSIALVGSSLNSSGTLDLTGSLPANTQFSVYTYLLDYRGSSRVGSVSSYTTVTTPAS